MYIRCSCWSDSRVSSNSTLSIFVSTLSAFSTKLLFLIAKNSSKRTLESIYMLHLIGDWIHIPYCLGHHCNTKSRNYGTNIVWHCAPNLKLLNKSIKIYSQTKFPGSYSSKLATEKDPGPTRNMQGCHTILIPVFMQGW